MINDQLSPEEQSIIQQIQAAPRLELGSAARNAIRERMLNEFRVVSQQAAANAAAHARLVFVTVTAAVVITVIIVIVLAVSRQNEPQAATAVPTIVSTSPQATSAATQLSATAVIISPTLAAQDTLTLTPAPSQAEATEVQSLISTESITQQTTANPTLTEENVLVSQTTAATAGITPSLPLSLEPSAAPSSIVSPAATAAPTLSAIIVIEGPVINIVNNVITIYDFDVEVEANHPILNLIAVGDIVHIEGSFSGDHVVAASVISNLSDAPLVSGATVSLDGPIESINGNIIVVNGISVQLEASDPLLQTIQVGQFVSVQGNFRNTGNTFVLVVVTVIVNVNTNTNNNSNSGENANCYWQENGMSGMGKWKCNGKASGNNKGSN